jgi:nitrite reductase/ring-hydroxylating ferredoxin subunit
MLATAAQLNNGPVHSFGDPGRKVIGSEGVEVGVFKLDDEFFAYESVCPNLGGRLAKA